MHPKISGPAATAFSAATTAPRPTPTPVRVRFRDVAMRGMAPVMRGAEAAMNVLPGPPLMVGAVRGAQGPALAPTSGLTGISAPAAGLPTGGGLAAPAEGPGAVASGAGTALPIGSSGAQGVEGAILQSQELSLYYLQVQERVNQQNRSFTTLSNVLKAEHETVKTAISNIR